MKNSDLLAFSLENLAVVKAAANEIWSNQVVPEKDAIISLISVVCKEENSSAERLATLSFVEEALKAEHHCPLGFREISEVLKLLAQNRAQEEFAQYLMKFEELSRLCWLQPEKVTAIEAEKIAFFAKKILETAPAAHLETASFFEQKSTGAALIEANDQS